MQNDGDKKSPVMQGCYKRHRGHNPAERIKNMSVWKQAVIEKNIPKEEIINVLEECYTLNTRQLAQKEKIKWIYGEQEGYYSPSECIDMVIKGFGYYQLCIRYDDKDENKVLDITIQTQKHITEQPMLYLLRRYGGKYIPMDINPEDYEIIIKEDK
jgi:hypothetical protein